MRQQSLPQARGLPRATTSLQAVSERIGRTNSGPGPFVKSPDFRYISPKTTRAKNKTDIQQKLADRLGIKLSQLALAWCLKNENVASVITGASKPEQIVDNVNSLKVLPKLTHEIMAEIDEFLLNKPTQDPDRQD